ncbi:MAG: hypothetical protein JEZ12_22990 [Desulfobacterium sp.]|nr:hypothetical protein [Desulfobacterium sp.]
MGSLVKIGGGPEAVKPPSFKWVNTVLGNLKKSVLGTYHGVGPNLGAKETVTALRAALLIA